MAHNCRVPFGESVVAGTGALHAGRWGEARSAFEAALRERESAEVLAGLGEALWWLGEPRSSIEHYERAFVGFRRAGDPTGAAATAMWLCLAYKLDLGNQAAASGWIARAERVLREEGPGPLQGWLWLTRAYDADDPAVSRGLAERALEFARSAGDVDLELCALCNLGKALVALGHVEEGLTLVDEGMAGTLGGECRRLDTVVSTSCSMLAACELAADLERAAEWCRVVDTFVQKYGCPFLRAECRTLYGGILVARGRWAEAEVELLAAVGMTRDVWPAMYAQALARLADLRLRQGRLEEAEGLLTGVGDELAAALPSAAIRLARGEPSVALALLQRRLTRLGANHIGAAQTLELLVQAYVARGDLDAAAAPVERLGALAREHENGLIAAYAAVASARAAAARGRLDAAAGELERALGLFSRLELPFESARVRLDLAWALVRDKPEVAVAEARAALRAFEQLGAASDADAAAALLRSLGAQGRSGPKHVGVLTMREREVLRLVGAGLTNPEIAQRLFISRKTAAHHVSSVLAKLDLRNRAEVVAYAARTGCA
jgi:DNA-binding CsgD family transcriptional regulator